MKNGMNKIEDFLIPNQKELFNALCRVYRNDAAVISNANFILVPGEAPVMLVAHLDTVHKEPVMHICESQNGNILMSPQGIGGDDRCGVYALVALRKQSKIKPWLLFTCDEETGGNGAAAFCKMYSKKKLPAGLDKLKMIIEIDRKGSDDAVYYDCANDDFEKYITGKGFKTELGSFSDISYIAPELGVAAVNLSSGYYNAHTLHEYINRKHLNNTIKRVLGIIEETAAPDFPKYEYIEAPRGRYYRDGCYSPFFRSDLDDAEVDPELMESVPEELRAYYPDLLMYFSFEDLEDTRLCYGDKVILQLYEEEFGCADFGEDP